MNGTPAFPINAMTTDEGMTLRDYFAAKAMQGLCSTLGSSNASTYWGVLAIDAYEMADAMIKAREA